MNDALRQLANEAGLVQEYWDGLGIRREWSEPTVRALLQGLGFDDSIAPGQHLETLADEAYARPLPPSLVLRQDSAPAVPVALPVDRPDTVIEWELLLEDGTALRGESLSSNLPLLGARTIGNRACERRSLPLPEGLPCGYHHLRLPRLDASAMLIVVPARCYIPTELEAGQRHWGLAVQLYALR